MRCRSKIERLEEDLRHGKHARAVMRAYEKWLGEQQELPMLAILRILGLFDRPAEPAAVAALRTAPAIPGLTEALIGLDQKQWRQTLSALRRIQLLAKEEGSPETLDTHPLVRQYFAEELRKASPTVWQDAHLRLFNHYRDRAESFRRSAERPQRPLSLAAMEPALRAVRHGCLAQRHVEALQLHYEHILHGEERFIWKRLGSFESNLSALTYFFESQWQPLSSLPDPEQVWVLGEVALSLFCLGQAKEAFDPSRLAAERSSHTPYYMSSRPQGKLLNEVTEMVLREVTDWCQYNAAVHWGTHSTICLALGRIKEAVLAAETAVESAERSGDTIRRIYNRCILANAYHQAGDIEIERARQYFEEAEKFQIAKDPSKKYLDSIKGYTYCDLLLTLGKHDEVEVRAKEALLDKKSHDSLVAEAFAYLVLARCYAVDSEDAERFYSTAIQGLRDGGNQIYLCQGLLFKAAYHRERGEYDEAQECINEVRKIATLSEAMLVLTDLQIEQGYLLVNRGEREEDKRKIEEGVNCFKKAKEMITSIGYDRRKDEVWECLEKMVLIMDQDLQNGLVAHEYFMLK